MSIRPSYGKRSVLQVLSDGMSQRPPTGTSCCEEAALNAAEVDRLTRERDTLQRCVDLWAARAEKAEAERDAYAEASAAHREDWKQARHERDELYGYIAEYREMWGRELRRADCAETDLDLRGKELAEAEAEIAALKRRTAAERGERERRAAVRGNIDTLIQESGWKP